MVLRGEICIINLIHLCMTFLKKGCGTKPVLAINCRAGAFPTFSNHSWCFGVFECDGLGFLWEIPKDRFRWINGHLKCRHAPLAFLYEASSVLLMVVDLHWTSLYLVTCLEICITILWAGIKKCICLVCSALNSVIVKSLMFNIMELQILNE